MITQGFGKGHKILTIGFSFRIDPAGLDTVSRRMREYDFGIIVPIFKEGSRDINIFSPVEIERYRDIFIGTSISKWAERDITLGAGINHNKLSEILDAI